MNKKQLPRKLSSDDIVIEDVNNTLSPSHNMPTSVDNTIIEDEEASRATTNAGEET